MKPENVDFFFCFTTSQDAKNIAFLLEKKGFEVNNIHLMHGGDIPQWSLIVSKTINSENEIDLYFDKLTSYAKEFSGKFNGYERLLF